MLILDRSVPDCAALPIDRFLVIAWMQRRAARRVRVKVGDTEVVANNAGELYGLLDLAIAVEQQPITVNSEADYG
jgi:hypothetical protein